MWKEAFVTTKITNRIKTMSSSFTVYTIEYGNSSDRSFAMTELKLHKGFDYSGILIHSTKAEAEASLATEIAEGEDPEEMGVALLKINRNGDLYDEYGVMLHDLVSLQNGQSKREVRQHLQEYFLHELAGRRSHSFDHAAGM